MSTNKRVPYKLITLILTVFSLISCVKANQFKIAKIIEIPRLRNSNVSDVFRWSLDGSKIAYISDGMLRTWDTTEIVDSILNLENKDFIAIEWLTQDEVVIHTQHAIKKTFIAHQLLMVNISTKHSAIIRSYEVAPMEFVPDSIKKSQVLGTHPPQNLPTTPSFDGPYSDLAGQVFIIHDPQNIFSERRREYLSPIQKNQPEFPVISVNDSGVYLVNAQSTDSIALGIKASLNPNGKWERTFIRPDKQYATFAGTIMHLPTGQVIKLDSIFTKLPERTLDCAFGAFGFNPIYPEAAFIRNCTDHDSYGLTSLILYNLQDNTYLEKFDLPNAPYPTNIQYALDGLKIAYYSNNTIYVVYRDAI